ncbi:hypothetical protein IMG5_158860, partial [Ichthyophthirius multifiliis]
QKKQVQQEFQEDQYNLEESQIENKSEEQKNIQNQTLENLNDSNLNVQQQEELKNDTFKSLGVCDELLEACNRLKYINPTAIQIESLPYTLKGQDIIALAETGSGKTMAFALPVIQSLLDAPIKFLCAYIVTYKSNYVCKQLNILKSLGVGVSLKTTVIIGGLEPQIQVQALQKKPHIVVGTPGRILYHLQNTKVFNIKQLKYLILDEADKLLNMDFEKDINKILDVLPKKRNTFLFSATMTNKVNKLTRASLQNPVKIEVSLKYQTVITLVQLYSFIPSKYKDCYLVYTLNEFAGQTSIIFVTTCLNAIKLTLILKNLGFSAVTINGQMSQVKRFGAINKFKAGEKKYQWLQMLHLEVWIYLVQIQLLIMIYPIMLRNIFIELVEQQELEELEKQQVQLLNMMQKCIQKQRLIQEKNQMNINVKKVKFQFLMRESKKLKEQVLRRQKEQWKKEIQTHQNIQMMKAQAIDRKKK